MHEKDGGIDAVTGLIELQMDLLHLASLWRFAIEAPYLIQLGLRLAGQELLAFL